MNDDMQKSQPEQGNKELAAEMKADYAERGPQRELTFGEKRVGLTFNPSKLPQVDEVKRTAAFLIDYFKEFQDKATNPEIKRALAEAMTNIETGCMFAVKGLTYPY